MNFSSRSVGMKNCTKHFLLFLLSQLDMYWDTYANPVQQPYQRALDYHTDPNDHSASSTDSDMEVIEIPELELDQPLNENNEQLKYIPSLNLRNIPSFNDIRKIEDINYEQVFFLINHFSKYKGYKSQLRPKMMNRLLIIIH